MHGYPLRPALGVFAFAVALGLVYRKTRSLPRLVIAHWLFDLASMRMYLQHVGS
jgi:membrane protease YdiL (CAAX protease family)